MLIEKVPQVGKTQESLIHNNNKCLTSLSLWRSESGCSALMCIHRPNDSLCVCLFQPHRKKKSFIEKKKAVTFHLVHRSQRDPLAADEKAPQHVLLPTAKVQTHRSSARNQNYDIIKTLSSTWLCDSDESQVDVEKRREEQREFGVFFDDDYDYLQHLKEASGTTELVASGPSHTDRQRVHLRDEDEESEEEEEGDAVRPVSSPAVVKILEVWLKRFQMKSGGKEGKGPVGVVCCVYDASMWLFKDHFIFFRVNNTEMLSRRINHKNPKHGRL